MSFCNVYFLYILKYYWYLYTVFYEYVSTYKLCTVFQIRINNKIQNGKGLELFLSWTSVTLLKHLWGMICLKSSRKWPAENLSDQNIGWVRTEQACRWGTKYFGILSSSWVAGWRWKGGSHSRPPRFCYIPSITLSSWPNWVSPLWKPPASDFRGL